MLYLAYILIGILIIVIVDCSVTAFWAMHDLLENRGKDHLAFVPAFKKYFAKNNNIPTKFSDLFE